MVEYLWTSSGRNAEVDIRVVTDFGATFALSLGGDSPMVAEWDAALADAGAQMEAHDPSVYYQLAAACGGPVERHSQAHRVPKRITARVGDFLMSLAR